MAFARPVACPSASVSFYDQTRCGSSGDVRQWAWNYRTRDGHVEMGQMDWEVWKWPDSGTVEFHVHAVSRRAPIATPIVRLGVHRLRGHERDVFLPSTKRRMLAFTELALRDAGRGEPLRSAAVELTARRSRRSDGVHDELTRRVSRAMPRRYPVIQFPNPPLITASSPAHWHEPRTDGRAAALRSCQH
jgi:Domain of unknown function (DUF1990)